MKAGQKSARAEIRELRRWIVLVAIWSTAVAGHAQADTIGKLLGKMLDLAIARL